MFPSENRFDVRVVDITGWPTEGARVHGTTKQLLNYFPTPHTRATPFLVSISLEAHKHVCLALGRDLPDVALPRVPRLTPYMSRTEPWVPWNRLHQGAGKTDLQDVALLGVPRLDAGPRPRAQEAEADFAVLVEVGVQAVSVRVVVHPGRHVWVLRLDWGWGMSLQDLGSTHAREGTGDGGGYLALSEQNWAHLALPV